MKLPLKEKSLSLSETDEFFSHLYGVTQDDSEKTTRIHSVNDFGSFLSKWFISDEKQSDSPNRRWTTVYIFDEGWFHLKDFSDKKSCFSPELMRVINQCLSYCTDKGELPDWWKENFKKNPLIRNGADSFAKTIFSISKIKHLLAFHASLGWLKYHPYCFSGKELLEYHLNLDNLKDPPKALYIVKSGKTIGNELCKISKDHLKEIQDFFLNKRILKMVWADDYVNLYKKRPQEVLIEKSLKGSQSNEEKCFFLSSKKEPNSISGKRWRTGFTYRLLLSLIIANYNKHGVRITKEEIKSAGGWLPTISKDLSQLKNELGIEPLIAIKYGKFRQISDDFKVAILVL